MFVDENTKKIADEVIGLTKAGVTEVWQKIQQAAPELWKLVIRQKMLDGLELAIGAVLCLIAASFAIWAGRKIDKTCPNDEGGGIALAVAGGLAGVIGCVACLINAVDFLGNPAYWALKDILEMVRH